ncbi:MAG TPA: hypothetical protein VG890_02580 [Puia sp.]|nr:hypothetical protein [Puia sp.]
MARIENNPLLQGTRGAVGDAVYKKGNGKTLVGKRPDMSRVQSTKEQTKNRHLFKDAVAYASAILKDPQKRGQYEQRIRKAKGRLGEQVYPLAISEFLREHSKKMPKKEVDRLLGQYLRSFPLSERQVKGLRHLITYGQLTNANYRKLTEVSKPTATRDLQDLVNRGVIEAPAAKGAGAKYGLKIIKDEART